MVGKSKGVGNKGQHNIDGSNHSSLRHKKRIRMGGSHRNRLCFLCFHFLISFSFVLGEEGLELTIYILKDSPY